MRFDTMHICLLAGLGVLALLVVYLLMRGNKGGSDGKENLHIPPQPPQPQPQQPVAVSDDQDEIVLFFSHSCGHCVKMMPAWKEFTKVAHRDIKIQELTGPAAMKYGIRGFPTIRYYPRGIQNPAEYVEYTGNRSTASFLKFAASKGKEM